jgi:hypothetical protein
MTTFVNVTWKDFVNIREAEEAAEAEGIMQAENEAERIADEKEIAKASQAHFPLMLADTMSNGTGGKYYHAHASDKRQGSGEALCGCKPGRRGYWGSYFGEEVTCPRCKQIIGGVK